MQQLYAHSFALLTDLYQLTMANGYWKSGTYQKYAVFNLFYRQNPFQGGFAIAAGLQPVVEVLDGFRFSQDDIVLRGASIECRINAEDPEEDFRPSPGLVTEFIPPGGLGVRVDSHAHSGYRIPTNYDSMIGKLIVYGETRDEAIGIMRRALDEFVVEGVKTTIPLCQDIFRHFHFVKGNLNTGFIEEYFLS